MAEDPIPKRVHRRDASRYGLVEHVEPIEGSQPVDYHYLIRDGRVHLYREGTEKGVLHNLCSESVEEWEARQGQHQAERNGRRHKDRYGR